MTSKNYKKYYQLMVYCPTCGQYRETSEFSYRNVNAANHIGICNVCDWFRRHESFTIEGWNHDELFDLVEFVLTNPSGVINDFHVSHPSHTLSDIVQTYQKLHIGNKHMSVQCKCEYCGKEIYKSPCIFLNTKNLYCSHDCYKMDKSNHMLKGKDNPQYNRITTNCTYCGKEIEVIPWAYNNTNSYGENHNFCSQDCYWKFRKIHYVGDKAAGRNVEWTPELKEKMRLIILNNGRSSKRFDTHPQLIVNRLLESLKIDYQREYVIKYYAVDNFLIDYNLIIEVMGDYWHGNPLKYNQNRLMNQIQKKTITKDKQKHSYIKNKLGIEILYLWEDDILHRPNMCLELVNLYINSNGYLQNYHSFNYHLENSILNLNSSIINPYQNQKLNEYKSLIA